MTIVWDEKAITFGDRTIMFCTYENSDIMQQIDVEGAGFCEINAVVHMGDSKTNISVRNGGNSGAINVRVPNIPAVINTNTPLTVNLATPIMGVGNGEGKLMIIGRRGSR